MTRIIPTLWYAREAEEAARFYAAILPDSRIDRVSALAADSPSGPAESVTIVEFTLLGQPFMAFAAERPDGFSRAISLTVACDSQAEIDRIWQALLDGGEAEACGWLRDRWGLSWQIAPRRLQEMMASPDRAAAGRAARAMFGMVKLDMAALERAFGQT